MRTTAIPPTIFESFAANDSQGSRPPQVDNKASAWSRAPAAAAHAAPASTFRAIGKAITTAGTRLIQRDPRIEVAIQSRDLRHAVKDGRAADVERGLAGVADLNQPSRRTGDTAWHCAAARPQNANSAHILNTLMKGVESSAHGVRFGLINKKGETALSIAEKRNNLQFFQALHAAVKRNPGLDVGLDSVDVIGAKVGERTKDPSIRALIGDMRSMQKRHVAELNRRDDEPIYATVIPRELRAGNRPPASGND